MERGLNDISTTYAYSSLHIQDFFSFPSFHFHLSITPPSSYHTIYIMSDSLCNGDNYNRSPPDLLLDERIKDNMSPTDVIQ